jgi:hypothetical protein
MANERRYPVTFTVEHHAPPLTKEQIEAGYNVETDKFGAADAVAILSMLYPEDGSFGLLITSFDGRTGEEITDSELWKVWTMMADRLSKSKTLSEPKRELAEVLFGCVATALRATTTATLAAVPEGDDLSKRIARMIAWIPPHEKALLAGLGSVSAGFQFAAPEAWHFWRDRGTEVLENALMQRPPQPWIERVKAIWLGRE